MILKTIKCDVCGLTYTEQRDGAGFPGWGALHGIVLNGVNNPNLCPQHLGELAEAMDKMAKENSK